MDLDEIKEIIARDENRVLELKKTTGELIKGMQSLCAFLNTDGGWLFFGITPDLKILGHLPNELTVETIKQSHRSFPQNPIIAEALFKTGFLESWGTGVQRMMDACKDAGLPEPEYGTDGLFVWITFKRPSLDTNSDSSSDTSLDTSLDTNLDTNLDTSSDSNSDNLILSAKQQEVLMYCMVERTSREILEHINVIFHTKNRDKFINELVDAGLLKRTIPDKPNSPLQKYIKA